jgi:tRNA pseudouridine55 synthase
MITNKNNKLVGFLLVNKPENISSYDCIRHIKKIIKEKIKIGHTGTLDNFATGLLIICIGKVATKFAGTLTNLDKEYVIKAKLGELTDTLDCTGKVIEKIEIPSITTSNLQDAIKKLGKSYIQVPPIYSALKYKGKPLYHLARTKKIDPQKLEEIVKEKGRKVLIHSLELLEFDPPFFTIKAHVSKGTYARSLANDIAQILKVPATTYKLQRTKIGELQIQDAINLNKIISLQDIETNLISIEEIKQKLT